MLLAVRPAIRANSPRRQFCRCISQIVQAAFFDYDSLHRLQDYKEDMARSSAQFEDEKARMGSARAISSAATKPWEYKMHQAAASVFDYLRQEQITAGLVMPKHPREADVARFMELYGDKFSAVVDSEQVQLFPAPEPLTAAAESLDLLPHQVIFVGGSADLMLAAKEAGGTEALVFMGMRNMVGASMMNSSTLLFTQ